MAKKDQVSPLPGDNGRDHYVIVYLPKDNGAPVRTEVAGVRFTAGVEVKVLKTKLVEELITVFRNLPDGTAQSRGEHRKVPLGEKLKLNPDFIVDGVGAQRGRKIEVGAPKTADDYRKYAMAWILAADDAKQMDEQWQNEELLRAKCGCDETDESYLRPFFEAQHDRIAGSSKMREVTEARDIASVDNTARV